MDERVIKSLLDAARAKPGLSVRDMVDETSKRLGVGRHVVAKHLYQLWKEGGLRLEDPRPPSTLAQYAKSLYSLWFWALTFLIALTFSAIYLMPQTPPYVYLRHTVGSVFVLYFPGFALIEVLYPKREDLTPLERLALSIGLSLAVVPLVGLGLNYTPWGIRLDPIFVSLAFLTLTFAAVAVTRRFTYFKMGVEVIVEAEASPRVTRDKSRSRGSR